MLVGGKERKKKNVRGCGSCNEGKEDNGEGNEMLLWVPFL